MFPRQATNCQTALGPACDFHYSLTVGHCFDNLKGDSGVRLRFAMEDPHRQRGSEYALLNNPAENTTLTDDCRD